MNTRYLKITLISLFFFFPILSVQAANSLDVVINEIVWTGTEVSSNDEWIELFNNTNSPIDLEGWHIFHATQKGEKGSIINLSGTISPKGFYILERTDETTLPEIVADKIYTGALNNKGELLQLVNSKGTVIDEIDCTGGWFTGNNKTKQTMERINPKAVGNGFQNWQTSQNPGGTPKAKNSIIIIQSSEEPTPKPEIQSKEPQLITYSSGIVINEILPSPRGEDKLEEWLEILNKNDEEIDLSGWKIQDTKGAVTTYTFPEGTLIGLKGFLILARPTTNITLNNDGDGLELIQPDEKVIDEVYYEKALEGKSFNRINNDWQWSPVLTPGAENSFPEEKSIETKELRATLTETFPEEFVKQEFSKNFFFVLSIALVLAFLSGALVLILKKKIRQQKD